MKEFFLSKRYNDKEKIKDKLLFISKKIYELLKNDIPIDENCRIKTEAYKNIYQEEEIRKDNEYVKNVLNKIKSGEKFFKLGEQFEFLKTIILNKFLKDNFIIVRTSLYDDFKNKVDNIIFEKKTGNLVCAFDEIADVSGERYKEKKQLILLRNINGGVNLKYAFKLKDRKIVLDKEENIPIFYISLNAETIEEVIKNLEEDVNKTNDKEKKTFYYFINILNIQINDIINNLHKAINITIDKDKKNKIKEIKNKIICFKNVIYEICKNYKINLIKNASFS